MVDGQKMWLTNGGTANLVAVLVKTDEGAESVYRNMTTLLVEKPTGFGEVAPGLTVPGKIEKMGYKGVDTDRAAVRRLPHPGRPRCSAARPGAASTR